MTAALMAMPMVNVRKVRMGVNQVLVPVPVGMRLSRRISWAMLVLMVLIMHMAVLMLHGLVPMHMLVPLG